ncbi:pentatricopeptide repeat-containing protein at2g13600 [Phtheirospermum japonicum]|uniref:Pentatricopeptide repeat-containing protein at2g13600 n=1 Tax=Phtheirospermum japonicum TaxID=374723 RepID=A0A830CEY4_9LAMI|nr:pentatricopeptide repeat-containing protein at2g13600 [Phtheirospermum japonicum]
MGFGVKPDRDNYHTMIMVFVDVGWVEAAMMLAESLPWAPHHWVWGRVLFACRVHENNLLLYSLIRKLYDINSSNPDYRPPTHFLKMTLKSYIFAAFDRRHNNDVNYAKSMVESLIRKLPDQKHVDFLNNYLGDTVKGMASAEACNQRLHYSTVHVLLSVTRRKKSWIDTSKSCGKKDATIELLLPILQSLLEDKFPDFCLNIISKLDQVNQNRYYQLLSSSQRIGIGGFVLR